MTFFILVYILMVIGFLSLFFILYKKYVWLIFWRYFLLAVISFILWLVLYVVAFTTTFNPDILLYISRFLYSISFVSIYSMTLFFFFYWHTNYKRKKTLFFQKIFIGFSLILVWVWFFSDFFISKMIYNPQLQIHYEEFWIGFIFLQFSYFINPIVSLIAMIISYKRLRWLNRQRFSYLAIGYFIFLFLYVLFLAVLPTFWIWVMQREQILFFIPFLFSFLYASHRYKFTSLKLSIGRWIIFILSILSSFLIVFFLKHYLLLLDVRLLDFWWIYANQWQFSVFDFIIGVIIFHFIHKYFSKTLITPYNEWIFSVFLNQIRDRLPYLENETALNTYLWNEFKNRLHISETCIVFNEKNKFQELETYFYADHTRDVFLNDAVFLDENKTKYNKEKILNELNKKKAIYVPIYESNTKIIAFLTVGKKTFFDFYSSWEIELIKKLAGILEWHLKYLSIYKKIQDLSINLDKKVDEKTIEYNTLLSKQKEFIRFIWHEIKNPITNAIFLCDSLKSEIGNITIHGQKIIKRIREDSSILYDELIKVSHLVKHIFSTEQFDLDKVKLYKQKIKIWDFLRSEIQGFESSLSGISFDVIIQPDIGEKEIDEVQFRQVIQNLIINATKFASKEKPKVYIEVRKEEKEKICIHIEDNGVWFTDIDVNSVFNKYSTGDGNSVGLGIWLYLCKRIVELHNGTITAWNGNKLGWAVFTIIF